MFKKVLIAAAIVIASPVFASAEDFFFSFSQTDLVSTSTVPVGTLSGSAYIFSDGLFAFDALDLEFATSDSSVFQFTGGQAFNPTFDVIGGEKFNSSQISTDPNTGVDELFSVNITQNGVNPALSSLFDPGFDAGVGPNGAVLLARVDYDIVGSGTADLNFNLGSLGAFRVSDGDLNPSFGSASLTVVGVPEPSSAALLILGSVGLVARRRRA